MKLSTHMDKDCEVNKVDTLKVDFHRPSILHLRPMRASSKTCSATGTA